MKNRITQLLSGAVLCGSLFISQGLFAQDTLKNSKDGNYLFTVVKDLDATDVENQNRTGTCWSFSALSFIESELIRMGKGEHNLSEMFVVRKAYEAKAEKYVRMHGKMNWGQGGAFHDIPYVIEKHGMVPNEVYTGAPDGDIKYNHSELESVLQGMLDAVIAKKQGKLTNYWMDAVNAVLDVYLGPVPENFEYKGKTYTPKSFAESLGLNMDDYIILTSFTHQPFYSFYDFDVPDNWLGAQAYNITLDELENCVNHAINNDYTIAWAADVSEKGFAFRSGLAIVPENDENLKQKGKDNKHFNDAGADRSGNQLVTPGEEKEITQEMRQQAYDNYETTDDHGMHIVGTVKDQNGDLYYIIKNSWGTDHNDCDGYFYASVPYVRYKTMNIMVHKSALPKDIQKKLK